MNKPRYTDQQIAQALRQGEQGTGWPNSARCMNRWPAPSKPIERSGTGEVLP